MSFSTPASAHFPDADQPFAGAFEGGAGMYPMEEEEREEVRREEPPTSLMRCDVSRGMQSSQAAPLLLDLAQDAPPFVVAFALEDPTAMPRLAAETIWAINYVRGFVERGEADGAYLVKGVPGFTLHKQPRRKHVLRRVGNPAAVPELMIQARVHDLDGVVNGRRAVERYLLLVVRSPLPFSLRLAVYLSCEGRGVDERAGVWSKLAMHVRSGVEPALPAEAMLRTFEESLDWMRTSDAGGFTCLFSAHMALDWMRHHYLRRYQGQTVGVPSMEGLRDPLDTALVGPAYIEQCAKYDRDVNDRVVPSGKPGRKGGARKRRKADEEEEAEEEVDYTAKPMETIEPLLLADALTGGLPLSVASIEIISPTRHEQPPTLVEFTRQVRAFPESTMLELLRGCMHNLSRTLMKEMTEAMRGQGVMLSMAEVRDIVMGSGEYQLGRQMLCLGDETWGKQVANLIARAPADTRLNMYRDFLRVSFALAFTRATGSDGYTDDRVAAYGRYMLLRGGANSQADCRRLFEQTATAFPSEPQPASATHRAWRIAMELLLDCDRRVWNLRPDNLFLFLHLLIGDLMLAINFFGSVVDGAFNGIGGTVVVRDGSGSYRVRFMNRATGGRGEGDVMSKNNSSGADHTTNCFKQAIDIGEHEPRLRPEREQVVELKRVTETSLIQETCNVLEGNGSDLRVKHAITHTGDRKYSTELKTGGDQQSENCMSAIAWLIPRNTRARTANNFESTRENGETKERIRVEYRQVKGGYLAICSNSVRQGARERFHTMLAVSRSIASAAGGVDLGYASAMGQGSEDAAAARARKRRTALDGRVDRMTRGGDQQLGHMGRGIFFNALGVAFFTGFMQWTGMLGQIRETRTAAALLTTFDAHLDLCHDLLNPDMGTNSDRARFREISKARGVAASLLGISVRETIEAGRRKEPQQAAVERACMAFKAEGVEAALAWTMGDMLEHMLRLDFFLLMLVLARKFKVPVVALDALLAWLDTGDAAACPQARAFYDQAVAAGQISLEDKATDTQGPGADLPPPSACAMYLHDKSLEVTKLDAPFTPEVRTRFCEAVGKRLHKEFSGPLMDCCQIKDSEVGDDIVRGMLEHSIDKRFAWPSVLMASGPPRALWTCVEPGRPPAQDPDTLALAPLRMFMTETTVATLYVDLRWMLLANALGQGQITQAARFTIVAQLVQRFYQHCVPPMLAMGGADLFLALPTQVVGAGFVWAPLLPSRRRTLRRPSPDIGVDAPGCPTGMIEDLGVAAPRYELAVALGLDERELPTDCVHYHFPAGVWTPALMGDEPISLRWERDGRFWMQRERDVATDARIDITAGKEGEGFLGGRVTRDVRPLCAFYRPGTVVRVSEGEWGSVGELQGGVYLILPMRARMTPLEVQSRVLRPDTRVWVRAGALPPRLVGDGEWATGLLEGLDVEDVPPGHFALRMKLEGNVPPADVLFGASHGSLAFRECELRDAPRFVLPAEALCAQPPAGARVLDTVARFRA